MDIPDSGSRPAGAVDGDEVDSIPPPVPGARPVIGLPPPYVATAVAPAPVAPAAGVPAAVAPAPVVPAVGVQPPPYVPPAPDAAAATDEVDVDGTRPDAEPVPQPAPARSLFVQPAPRPVPPVAARVADPGELPVPAGTRRLVAGLAIALLGAATFVAANTDGHRQGELVRVPQATVVPTVAPAGDGTGSAALPAR